MLVMSAQSVVYQDSKSDGDGQGKDLHLDEDKPSRSWIFPTPHGWRTNVVLKTTTMTVSSGITFYRHFMSQDLCHLNMSIPKEG